MKELIASRPYRRTILCGILMIPFVVLMNSYSPPKEKIPQGYGSSILAFEFASDKGEADEVFQPLTTGEVAGLDRINYIDFGFMIMYGLFLFTFMSQSGELFGSTLLHYGKWIAPVIVIADVIENIQLLDLSAAYSTSQPYSETALLLLAIFTWTKWLSLAVAFALIAYQLIDMKWPSRTLGYVLFFPLGLGIGAWFNGARWTEELFATSIFAAFLCVFIYAIFFQRAHKSS